MPTPRSNEKRPQFIQRCMSIIVNEGKDTEQAYAICSSKWGEKLADRQKVSFDFDDTLTTLKGKNLAKRLISSGKSVYIITRRQSSEFDSVYEMAKELGISKNKVIFTNGELKWRAVKRLDIGVHYDNNQNEIDKINENTDATGILI